MPAAMTACKSAEAAAHQEEARQQPEQVKQKHVHAAARTGEIRARSGYDRRPRR